MDSTGAGLQDDLPPASDDECLSGKSHGFCGGDRQGTRVSSYWSRSQKSDATPESRTDRYPGESRRRGRGRIGPAAKPFMRTVTVFVARRNGPRRGRRFIAGTSTVPVALATILAESSSSAIAGSNSLKIAPTFVASIFSAIRPTRKWSVELLVEP